MMTVVVVCIVPTGGRMVTVVLGVACWLVLALWWFK